MLPFTTFVTPKLSCSVARARGVRQCCSNIGTAVRDLRSAVAPAQLQNGEVHIYWAFNKKIEDSCLERFQQCLTPEEADVINNVADAGAKRQRLLARALTRTILPAYVSDCCDAQSLDFLKNEHGKPFIAPRHFPDSLSCNVDFNLTHTTSAIGCAVGQGVAVGLDVEEVHRRPRNMMQLAKRRFSPAEYDLLAGVSGEEERARVFLQLWTLKEALVKARGTGISCPPGLSGFSIGLQQDLGLAEQLASTPLSGSVGRGGLRITLDSDKLPEGCAAFDFLLMQPSPDHVAALCVMRAPPAGSGRAGDALCAVDPHQHPVEWRQCAAAAAAAAGGEAMVTSGHNAQQQGAVSQPDAAAQASAATQAGMRHQHAPPTVQQPARPRLAVRCFEVAGFGDVRPAGGSCVVLGSS